MERIETERLYLEPISVAEIQKTIDRESDAELKKAYTEMRDGVINNPEKKLWYTPWNMILKESGKVIGDLSFKGFPEDKRVDIGYGINKEYQNMGYATEAVGGMVSWAFDSGASAVTGETDPDNNASKKVLAKNGFIPFGYGEEGPIFIKYKSNVKPKNDFELARSYLVSDYLRYADMITGIDLGMVTIEHVSDKGVLLYYPELTTYSVAVFKGDYEYMFSLMDKYNDTIITHDKVAYSIVHDRVKTVREAVCYNAVFTNKTFPKLRNNAEIKKISLEFFDYVNSNYTRYDASDEIRYNLANGRMLGAFIDGKIVGYIGFHKEGSIGMLYVDERYRRLGIGGDLLIEQLKYAKENNLSTYTQIVEDNNPSIKMHFCIGFKLTKNADIVWHIKDVG